MGRIVRESHLLNSSRRSPASRRSIAKAKLSQCHYANVKFIKRTGRNKRQNFRLRF